MARRGLPPEPATRTRTAEIVTACWRELCRSGPLRVIASASERLKEKPAAFTAAKKAICPLFNHDPFGSALRLGLTPSARLAVRRAFCQ
jgi:hypothetical protein